MGTAMETAFAQLRSLDVASSKAHGEKESMGDLKNEKQEAEQLLKASEDRKKMLMQLKKKLLLDESLAEKGHQQEASEEEEALLKKATALAAPPKPHKHRASRKHHRSFKSKWRKMKWVPAPMTTFTESSAGHGKKAIMKKVMAAQKRLKMATAKRKQMDQLEKKVAATQPAHSKRSATHHHQAMETAFVQSTSMRKIMKMVKGAEKRLQRVKAQRKRDVKAQKKMSVMPARSKHSASSHHQAFKTKWTKWGKMKVKVGPKPRHRNSFKSKWSQMQWMA